MPQQLSIARIIQLCIHLRPDVQSSPMDQRLRAEWGGLARGRGGGGGGETVGLRTPSGGLCYHPCRWAIRCCCSGGRDGEDVGEDSRDGKGSGFFR